MWDYGKEISITLEDALYSPASQSLMWGGKFGTKHTKIYGAWNPYIYEKDKLGRNIYMNKTVTDYERSDAICFTCPCDGSKKWAKFSNNEYKTITNITGTNKTFHGKSFTAYTYETLESCFGKRADGTGLEKAEITIDNFGKFAFNAYVGDGEWASVTANDSTPAFCDQPADVYEYM